MKNQSSAAECAVKLDGGQLSLTFSNTIWVDKHNGKKRINHISAVRKIWLKERGHVLAKKYIDTLKMSLCENLISGPNDVHIIFAHFTDHASYMNL